VAKILVVAETEGGRPREASLELITLARELSAAAGWDWAVAVLGADPSAPAQELARGGGGRVIAVADPALADYTADGATAALERLVRAETPELVLVSHGPAGWDFAPRLAARCGGAAGPECTDVAWADGTLAFKRRAFGGKLEMAFELHGAPKVVTVQRGARPAAEPAAAGAVETFAPGLAAGTVRASFGGVRSAGAGKLDLGQAEVIVSGGRALGGPDKFQIIKDLAAALGGQVGASRPVTDSGWLPPEHQVGSSGTTVKPKLYVACGISGAIQHVVGMKSSQFIIAINKDARAPIFDVAHVGVVGDLFEIVPALTAAVREARGR
jgi:electron transfer flavoprotein alpha subunit